MFKEKELLEIKTQEVKQQVTPGVAEARRKAKELLKSNDCTLTIGSEEKMLLIGLLNAAMTNAWSSGDDQTVFLVQKIMSKIGFNNEL